MTLKVYNIKGCTEDVIRIKQHLMKEGDYFGICSAAPDSQSIDKWAIWNYKSTTTALQLYRFSNFSPNLDSIINNKLKIGGSSRAIDNAKKSIASLIKGEIILENEK